MSAQRNWRRSYQEMFRRCRTDALEIRRNGGPWISDAKIDAQAWRDAERYVQRAINMHNEAINVPTTLQR